LHNGDDAHGPPEDRPNLEEVFASLNFPLPPARLIEGRNLLDLENVVSGLGGGAFYRQTDEEVKAIILYFVAHYGDEQCYWKLEDKDWLILFKVLSTDEERRERMRTILQYDLDWEKTTEWFPNFPFKHNSLTKWRSMDGAIAEPKIFKTVLTEDDPPIQLCQIGKNCFMTQDIIVLSYYVKRHFPERSLKRISMDEIRSHCLDQRTMYQFVVQKLGFHGHIFLSKFLGGKYKILVRKRAKGIAEAMDKYGPGLIRFRVEDDFRTERKLSYSGTATFNGSENEWHDSALVGILVDSNNTCWLLVQNSWKSKQFVTMTHEYFRSCGGEIHFIDGDGQVKDFFETEE
jgi:hypothetical protein